MSEEYEFESEPVQSSLPTPWQPDSKGQYVDVEFMGEEEIPAPDPGKGKKGEGETFTSYRGALVHACTGMFGAPDPEEKTLVKGDMVSFSGAFLGSLLNQFERGDVLRIRYDGTRKVKNGNAKQFSVFPAKGVKPKNPYAKTRD